MKTGPRAGQREQLTSPPVAITWWVGDPTRTGALSGWFGILAAIVAIELVWAVSYSIWPRSKRLSP